MKVETEFPFGEFLLSTNISDRALIFVAYLHAREHPDTNVPQLYQRLKTLRDLVHNNLVTPTVRKPMAWSIAA